MVYKLKHLIMRTIIYIIAFMLIYSSSNAQSSQQRVEGLQTQPTNSDYNTVIQTGEKSFNTSIFSPEYAPPTQKTQGFVPDTRNLNPAAGVYHGSASATYTDGDILTDYNTGPDADDYSDCPGTLVVTIPYGAVITGVDVYYEMTAIGAGWMSDQRSRIVNTNSGGSEEDSYHMGSGGQTGTYIYQRSGLDIANDVEDGGNITFELHAFRTYGNSDEGCDAEYNIVDDGTWSVTVHYTAPLPFYDDFEGEELAASWTQYIYGSDHRIWNHSSVSFSGEQGLSHAYNIQDESNNWLVSPAIELPSDHVTELSFWYYGAFYGWYTYTGLWISDGSSDPQALDFEEIFEFDDITANQWQHFSISLEDYQGEEIYIALWYQGEDGHTFRADEFRVLPQVETPAYYYDYVVSEEIKLMDVSTPQNEYNIGMTTPAFPRAATFANGRYLQTSTNVIYSLSPDSLVYDTVITHGSFSNGLAFNHLTNELYLIGGNFGGNLYAVDMVLEEVNTLGSAPGNVNMLDGAFDNHGNLYITYTDSDSDEIFLGIMNTETVEITPIGSVDSSTGTINSLFFDYTNDNLYIQHNTSSTSGSLYVLDRESADMTEVTNGGENSRFSVATAYSNVFLEVTDGHTGDPIEEATILFENNTVQSDNNGEALLALGYGTHEFVIEKPGYFDYHGSFELGKEHKLITVSMDLRPEVSVNPDSFSETLAEGESFSRTFSIENPVEGSQLNINMALLEGSSAKKGMDELNPRLIPGQADSNEALVQTSHQSGNRDHKFMASTDKSTDKSVYANVLYLESMSGDGNDFYNELQGLPSIYNLDVVNLEAETPNVDYMLGYHLIIVATNFPVADSEMLGDNLAQYVDAGGKLILMQGAFALGGDWYLTGEIMTPPYSPVAASPYSLDDAVAIDFADHPITESVNMITTGLYGYLSLQGDGVSLGDYDVGYPVGAYNPDKSVVGLNIFPGDTFWEGDLMQLMDNTINWMLETPEWLSLDMYSATISGGSSQEVTLTFDAENLTQGNYEASIRLVSNELETGFVSIPVNLEVEIAEYDLSLTANPASGGSVSGEGSYQAGETVTATATANQGYEFINWTHDGTEVSNVTSYSFDMPAEDYALTAHFSEVEPESYTLTINIDPEEGGTVVGEGPYGAGESVTVTATSNAGYEFVNWTHGGSQVSADEEYTFFMPAQDYTLTANFIQEDEEGYTLILVAEPADGGVLSGGGNYEPGESVTITATANQGYEFINWTHNDSQVSAESTYNFFMPGEDYDLVANFELATTVTENPVQELEVYPNPATHVLNIQSPVTPDAIQIFNLSGSQVYRSESPRISHQLTIETFDEGLYLIRVIFEDEVQTRKVLIQP